MKNIELIGRIHNINFIENVFNFYVTSNKKIYLIKFESQQKLNNKKYKIKEKQSLSIIVSEQYDLIDIKDIFETENFIFDPMVNTKYQSLKKSSCISPSYLFDNKISCGITDNNSLHYMSEMQENDFILNGVSLEFYKKQHIFRFIYPSMAISQFSKIVVVDLETTSHDSLNGEIIEIGICNIENNIIDMKLFSEYYKTNLPITKFITSLTGIDKQLLDKKGVDRDKHLLDLISKWERENVLIVSYRKFDLSFLNSFFYKHNNRYLDINYLDCFELFRVMFPSVKPSLTKYLSFNNIERKFAHKASFDAYYTAKLLEICFKNEQINLNIPVKDNNNDILYYEKTCNYKVWAIDNEGITQLYDLLNQKKINFDEFVKNKKDLIIGVEANDKSFFDEFFFESYLVNKKEYINLIKQFNIIAIVPFEAFWVASTRTIKSDTKDFPLCSYEESQMLLSRKTILQYYDVLMDILGHRVLFSALPCCIYPEEERAPFLLSQNFREKKINFLSSKAFLHTENDLLRDFSDWDKINIVIENNKYFMRDDSPIINEHILPSYSEIYNKGNEKELKLFDDLLEEKGKNIYKFAYEKIKYRLKEELEIIIKNNFFNFFYYISLTIQELKSKLNCIIGSRGSVGSSLVAFILGITEVNPLPAHQICFKCETFKWLVDIELGIDNPEKICSKCNSYLYNDGFDIDFSTFINPYRLSLPDIDLNISTNLHKEALKLITEYVKKFNVTCIKSSAILRIKEKNALIYLNKSSEILSSSELSFYGSLIQNIKLSVSQHPGGLFFFPNNIKVSDITPLQFSEGEQQELVTHFDYYHIANSIMKFDLLAHEDPSTLQELLHKNNMSLNDIHIDNNIYNLFKKSECNGIPEFGTSFGRTICKETKPNNCNDLVKINGLMHGKDVWSNNGRELFKQGKNLNEIISTRDDIYKYLHNNTNLSKKDIISIIDIIKKGKINKNIVVWLEYEKKLIKNKIPMWLIDSLKKMTYLFPKPHAVAYTLMAIKIAYFKYYFPVLFFTSYFNRKQIAGMFDMEFLRISFSNVVIKQKHKLHIIEQIFVTLDEIRKKGINICIDWKFSLGNKVINIDNNIYLPFSFIKGFGKVAENIQELRDEKNMSQAEIIKELKWTRSKLELLSQYGLYEHKTKKTPPSLF